MRSRHVGCLVILASEEGALSPVGLVTDRDLVVEVLAQDVDPTQVTLGDIMSPDPVTVNDVLDLLSMELSQLTNLINYEQTREARTRP